MVAWHAILCLAASVLWVLGVSLIGRLPYRHRMRALVVAVVAGVPILGLVTWKCGPLLGLAAFLVGLALLLRPQRTSGARTGRALPSAESD
ncbi:DUF2484 family protein [Paracoccus endophyticus]|uniref:DUF2484 family protein n=1 Tax=Paracoccus endophyticus TaxID=2233774 RepID=UPI000DDAFD72|nr:DUF2484 family protein [Paracoccus endophyticus]